MVYNTEGSDETPAPSRAEDVARNVISGHPRGAVRRILLYTIVGTALAVSIGTGSVLGIIVGAVGIVALLLLAMTDVLA